MYRIGFEDYQPDGSVRPASLIEMRWGCILNGCTNEARYVPAGATEPRYCAIHDMLHNGGNGTRIEERDAYRLLDAARKL